MPAKLDPDIIKAAVAGFRILPHIIKSMETLFGKKTGETKKQAATDLFNAALWGAAQGTNVAGQDQISQTIVALAPAVSSGIDELASTLFPND